MMRRQGMALAVILMATALLFVVAVAAVTESTTDLQLVTSRIHDERALYAAEAGIQNALVEIDRHSYLPDEYGSFQPVHPGGVDGYKVEHYVHETPPTGGAAPCNHYLADDQYAPDGTNVTRKCHYLVATGRTDRGTTRQVGVLCVRTSLIFNQGVLADQLSATNSSLDAWNSDDHPTYSVDNRVYGLDVLNSNSVTAGCITLDDHSSIFGRANSGPGSIPADVIQGGNVLDKQALTDKVIVGDTTLPTGGLHHPSSPTFNGDVAATNTIDTGIYRDVDITNGAKVTFNKGKYVFSTLTVHRGGKIHVTADDHLNPVQIWVTDTMKIEGENSIVNDAMKACLLRINYSQSDDTLIMSGGSQAFFTLQAPLSNIILQPPSDSGQRTQAYGAIVAKQVKMDKAEFHYDVGLRQDGFELGHLLTLSHRRF